jgi:hypothetical protein
VRVILDESVPIQTGQFLKEHNVTTVQGEGWAGVENGDLLNLVDGTFDVMVLADKNLRYQQNLATRRIAFVELPSNRWPVLQGLAHRIVDAVKNARPGGYTIIEG